MDTANSKLKNRRQNRRGRARQGRLETSEQDKDKIVKTGAGAQGRADIRDAGTKPFPDVKTGAGAQGRAGWRPGTKPFPDVKTGAGAQGRAAGDRRAGQRQNRQNQRGRARQGRQSAAAAGNGNDERRRVV